MLVKRVVWFLCFMFLFLFVFLLVLFLSNLKNSFVLFCFCVVLFFCHKAKWSSCLHLVVLLPFLFLLFSFEFCLFFGFSFLSKKDPPKKLDTAKTQKSKNAEKTDKKKLAQLCSQIVFFTFLGWA